MLLSIKDAPVHSLVDALAGSGDGRGANGSRSLDRFGVDAHGGILTTHCKVASSRFGLGMTCLLSLFFQLFLGGLERRKVVARLNRIIVIDRRDRVGIFAVREGEMGVDQNHENHQRQKGDATEEVGEKETRPAPHLCISLVGEMAEGNGCKAHTKMG